MRETAILGLVGSARGDGDTARLARAVFDRLDDADLVDLRSFRIAPYEYAEVYADDDFHILAGAMTKARVIVFASPVYWYSMSTPMKVFFDRLTDLTGSKKPLGKSLAGKSAFLIASGGSAVAPAAFEPPFADTARYFNMGWGGMLYAEEGAIETAAIDEFAARIRDAALQSAAAITA